jgi:hypothetical protein
MMGERTVMQEALFYSFSIEDHVSTDHLLRLIDRFVDLDGIREHLKAYYSEIGRPSIDPELMIRMLIVGYCMGIRSERRLSPGAGALSPHVSIGRGDQLGRFDDIIGNGFVVIMRDDVAALGANQQAGLDAIGGHFAVIGAGDWRDLDGRLTGFMQANGWDAFVVRPDFYIYGGGTAKQLPAIVDILFTDLARAGVRLPANVNGEPT